MKLKSFANFVFAAATLTTAGPIHPRADVSSTTTFDQIRIPFPNRVGAQVNQLLGNTPLNFTDISTGNSRGVVTVGITPSSGANVGVSLQDNNAAQSTIRIPRRSNVTSFDLESFRFGCVYGGLSGTDPKGVSICIVGVNGYRNGWRVANQVFTFNPGRVTKNTLVPARLSTSFQNIHSVLFATVYSASITSGGATYFDDVKITAHSGNTTSAT
ncbi:hypothetical protein BKA67DRAFT_655813 [Truncatella angustata]|uniref:Secreted protein n=1 Tax=Truncatella angustata TaxID=152316 RepID=A0A9P8USU6_9PEZI|nr:uncharacterized protein BKA67DRAFT_655813 [Truncatella angustata]KAH6657556.1 hypothetical protein BKA67DRAFT_655813 [Truncatella angustata]